jgi:hypothetical protein
MRFGVPVWNCGGDEISQYSSFFHARPFLFFPMSSALITMVWMDNMRVYGLGTRAYFI